MISKLESGLSILTMRFKKFRKPNGWNSIFNVPVPQINNWIVASIRENNAIYFFGVDEVEKEFTAWCQESFSTIVILPKAPKSILKLK